MNIVCSILLLLMVAVPVGATITKISPAGGYTGRTATVTITGSNFSQSYVEVMLTKGSREIFGSTGLKTNTSVTCSFAISKTDTTGDWDLIVTNYDGYKHTKPNAFTVRKPMTLTSINPLHARVNNDSVDFTIVGTYLAEVEDVFLYNNDYDNITATDVVGISATRVEGTFDLTDAEVDNYDVCVVDDMGTEECDLTFEITTDEVGSIDISSSPSGASIYVDGSLEGTTPDTVENLEEGTYRVVLKKSGYSDWGKTIKVTAGDSTEVNAYLDAIATVSTTIPTTRPTTVKTTRASTLKVPTSWPSATVPATTTSSPFDPAVVLGAAGIALALVIHRRR